MTTIETEYDGLVVGLKKNVARFRNDANYYKCGVDYAEYNLLNSWKMIYNAGIRDELKTMIWTYVDKTDGITTSFEGVLNPKLVKTPDACRVQKKGSSKLIGKKTIIADYTNKKGKTHQAHYSYQVHNGCYLGPVSKLGNKPIYFDIKIDVEKSNAIIHLDRLLNVDKISDLFELTPVIKNDPEEEEFEDYEIEEELHFPKKNKIIN